jgi:hypothetical protein
MPEVFISYSHQDEPWKERVAKHLAVLADTGLAVWDDRRIAAGADWRAEINQAIAACDVALLLVSADFLTSRFILGEEVPAFLARRREQGIRVLPLIVAPCAWQRVPWLASLAVRPKDGQPLSGMSNHDAEAALAALTGEIADLLLTPISKASRLPSPGAPAGGSESGAAAIWREKLEFLRVQEAICSDPAQRFTLKKQIEEAEAKLRELS